VRVINFRIIIIIIMPEEDRATDTGNMQKLVKIAHVVPEIYPVGQTDRCTHLNYFATALAGEVIKRVSYIVCSLLYRHEMSAVENAERLEQRIQRCL